MNNPLCSNKGVTLIEVLVTSVIATVLAGIIMIIYIMYDEQIRENTAYLHMQMQYENVSEQIAFFTRVSHRILSANDPFYDSCAISNDTVQSILFYNSAENAFAGIGISNGILIELDTNTNNWIDFQSGNGTVSVDPSSSFILNGCRSGVNLNLRIAKTENDTTYYINSRRDQFLCRNW